jgi:hypothetical protein
MFNRRRRENRELSLHLIRAPAAVKHTNPEEKIPHSVVLERYGPRLRGTVP